MGRFAELQDGKAVVEGAEMRMSRVFDAPREMVWAAWTDPRHIVNWWGPRGFTATDHGMDVRAGGEWKLTLHGPDGTDYPNCVLYEEVVRPSLLRYKHTGAGSNVVVRFEDEDGKTRVTMTMTFPSADALETIRTKYKADEGMAQTIARLGEFLTLQKARVTGVSPKSE